MPTMRWRTITDRPISYIWQVERDPVRGAGVFRDIVDASGDKPATADGTSFRVTSDLDGLRLRVRAVYQDDDGVLENVFSAPTAAVAGVVAGAGPTPGTARADGCQRWRALSSRLTCSSFSTRSSSPKGMRTARISSTSSRTHAWPSACGRSMDRSTTWCRVRAISAPPTPSSRACWIRCSGTTRTATPLSSAREACVANTDYASTGTSSIRIRASSRT